MATLPTFFLGNIGQENVWQYRPGKTRSLKSRKIDIFPMGLTHGFSLKMAIFGNCFFLGNIGQENVYYDILERKNSFLGYNNN